MWKHIILSRGEIGRTLSYNSQISGGVSMDKQKAKPTYITEEQKEQILKLHSEGWSTKQIYEKVGTTKSATYNFMRRMGLKSNNLKAFDPPTIDRIKELYLNGLAIEQIHSQHYPNIPAGTINHLLRRMGITRPNGHVPKFNQDYFEVIDSERKAYWLGFIMADGGIIEKVGVKGTITGKTLSVEIKKDDDYLLKELVKDLEADKKVKYCYSEKQRGEFKKPKHNAYIRFGSRKMCDDLEKYGIVPRKSLITNNIPDIPKEYIRHYIRGFFDGDGSVNVHKKWDVLTCVFYGTTETLEILQAQLMNDLDFKERVIVKQKNHNVSLYAFGSQEDVRAFYKYIYEGATIYLKRKKEVFDSHRIIKDIKI